MAHILLKHSVYKSLDTLTLVVNEGNFHQIGKVQYVEVTYGEYFQGDYAGTTKEGCHYMAAMGAYFPLDKIDEALEYFMIIDSYYKECDNNPTWKDSQAGKVDAYNTMSERRKRFGYSMEQVKQMNLEFFGA